MSSSSSHLVMMINQIARNLAYDPDPAGATAEHIRMFWDPQMKRAIQAVAPDELSLVALLAVALLADASSPRTPRENSASPSECADG